MKSKKPKNFNDQYKSDEERWFSWYLAELKEAGFIKSYTYEPETIELFPGAEHIWEKELKTKIVERTSCLLQRHVYTPDFSIFWDYRSVNIFYRSLQRAKKLNKPFIAALDGEWRNIYSLIEIKPTFDQHNMTREFMINQKWVYQETGKYIQLIHPDDLFKKTFAPQRYVLDMIYKKNVKNKEGVIIHRPGESKLKYKPKTLGEYLEGRL